MKMLTKKLVQSLPWVPILWSTTCRCHDNV